MKLRLSLPVMLILLIAFSLQTSAQETITLPAPKIHGQLMKSLENRVSTKGFSPKELSDRTLSEVLWAAFGINNPRTGRRTAPSAFNTQEIDIYVLTARGAYRYNAKEQSLSLVSAKDIRSLVATQDYAKPASVQLLYVADYDRTRSKNNSDLRAQSESFAMLHTGCIGQNVYLYCASRGLATVIRSAGNANALRSELKLRENQQITVSQAVGYPPGKK
ncbi:SagB/ThcOx family dehydrogenase [bacterium]|nr:SagB/ThcOx family dehydrogenase [bacterium]